MHVEQCCGYRCGACRVAWYQALLSRLHVRPPRAGRGIFYPLLYGTSKGEVVVLTKRMFDDDEMVLGKWMASMGRILL